MISIVLAIGGEVGQAFSLVGGERPDRAVHDEGPELVLDRRDSFGAIVVRPSGEFVPTASAEPP